MATARDPAARFQAYWKNFQKFQKIWWKFYFIHKSELFMSSNKILVPFQSRDVNIELIVYVINRLLNPNCTHGTGGLDLTLSNLEPSTFGPT